MVDSIFTIPEDTLRKRASMDGITHLSTGIAAVRNGKVLVVRREASDYLGGNYELPGGGVDPDETLLASVTRELREETGLTLTSVRGMFPGFDYTTPSKPRVRQFNFLVEATGEVKLSAEHDAFKWVALDEITTLSLTKAMKTCIADALELAVSF